ncbi:MAG: hypothetical protein KA716_25965 [Gloeotrichia echinulata DEX184]|nr:hypothetical protein [Gloeotrichia echinulata DEX184]
MEVLTLQQVFGENAFQSSNTLTISKADLVSVGLPPTTVNTAESLLAAIILKLLRLFSDGIDDGMGDALTDEDGNAFEIGNGQYLRKLFL